MSSGTGRKDANANGARQVQCRHGWKRRTPGPDSAVTVIGRQKVNLQGGFMNLYQ